MPPPARPMRPGEMLIVIAEDDDTYAPRAAPLAVGADKRALPPGLPPPPPSAPEKILLCGMRRDVDDVIAHLDSLLAPGSEVHLIDGSMAIEDQLAELERGKGEGGEGGWGPRRRARARACSRGRKPSPPLPLSRLRPPQAGSTSRGSRT